MLPILHVFNRRYCRSVLKTPNDDFSAKKSSAKAVKKLNKENKFLFGSLLETLPEKRKRQKQERKACLSYAEMLKERKPDRTEEAWWLSRMSSSKLLSAASKPSTDDFIYSDGINQSCTVKANERVDATENLYSENTSSEMCKTWNTVPESQVVLLEPVIEKGAAFKERKDKCNDFILPEVIIRNIPTFPLLRERKIKESIADNVISSPLIDADDKSKKMLMYPSVTKVLNVTMSESSLAALKRWRLKMIADLGEEGFQTHYKAVLEAGALFHDTIQNYLAGTLQKVDPQIEGCWESLEVVLPNIRNVKLLESHVVHSNLLYRGVIDCVAEYKKSTLLIEWKKSDKQKPELEKTYDAPLQVSAYMGAVNCDLNYQFKVEGGLVVVAYTDGSPAHIFPMSMSDCQKYWSFWLKRLQQYWLQQSSPDS